ncbi:WS/DGAT domain-containing protein [Nocardia cyriacigeorgica]|uniref:WS/DGAT domain-containing protein n=1 Tax=Nocardia cyriacigeorgica TaxID=135487 RepID=UPI002490AB9B|nr:WS/DGAT domain-containing protein [Nocardia cyriacigeorgica]BDT84482.1 hypothetical protein FMUAM8_02460 [Nocardia cyriacigeorgica]
MSKVEPQDATMYWLSRRTRNDLFLLYCFAETELSTDQLRATIAHRSATIPDLCLRLRPAPRDLRYPTWVRCAFDPGQFVEHRLPQADWTHLEQALGEVLATGVDAAERPWRLHVFRGIAGAPLPSQGEHARRKAAPAGSAQAAADATNGPQSSAAPPRAAVARARDVEVAGSPTGVGATETAGLSAPEWTARAIADSSESAASDRVTVAVLQMSHALADGKRAAELARALFAPTGVDPGPRTSPVVRVPATEVVAGPDEREGPGRSAGAFSATARERSSVDGAGAHSNDSGARARAMGSAHRPWMTRRAFSTATELFRMTADAIHLGAAVAAIPVRMARTMAGGVRAFRAQRALAELTEAGTLPAAGGGFAPSVLNGPGEVGGHRVRMVVCPADQLRAPGFSVTVLALTAVSIALERYLECRASLPDRLGAQVPMALPALRPARGRDANIISRAVTALALAQPRNNYRSLGVDLSADEPDPRRRAERIAADLAARRTRAVHPLLSVQDRVTASLPAPILRRDVDRYPIDTIPDALAGHTVVSSVYRGPADLAFGDAPVLFTAGFPALGAVMHLTHGVHGLGDTVTISVHADPATIPDLDCYADLLRAALDEVSARVRDPE